jgi:predicted  nucleic acid-binding Zn-ribbon protein
MDSLMGRLSVGLNVLGIALLVGAAGGLAEEPKAKTTYDDHVKPILRQKCFACHNPDKKSGDLDLTNYTTLMAGGGSGAVISAGDPGGSYLYMLITHEGQPYMPPESPKLGDDLLETVRKWIEGGALENAGSEAKVAAKPKFEMALQTAPSQRPSVIPMPGRMVLEPVLRTRALSAVVALATSPWAPLAAVGGPQQVLLYNTQTLELLGVLPFPEGAPYVLKFSRNGALLLAGGGIGGQSGRAIVWNVANGQRVFEIGDDLDSVLAADISSDQTLIAMGGPQRVVRVYSTKDGQRVYEMRKHTDWITSLEFSPDSVLLASGDRNGGVIVCEAPTGRDYLTLSGHTAAISGVSWRGDSNVVGTCSEDGTIRLWEMENGNQIKNWGAHGGGASSLEFARDGRIVSSGRDRVVKLWDANGGQQRAFEAFGDLALRASICDETDRVIGGDWSGAIRVWNAADGAKIGELTTNPPTLAERLAAATQAVTARQAEQQPHAQALLAATTALDGAKSQLAAAQNAVQAAEQKVAASTEKLNGVKQAVAKAKSESDVAQQAVATLESSVAMLMDACGKCQQAKEKAPGDAELADIAAKILALTQARSAGLEAQRKAAAEKAGLSEAAGKDLAAVEKDAADATAAMTAARAQADLMAAAVKPAEEQAAKARAAADAANAAVDEAQKQVQRWQGEIEFAKQQAAAATAPAPAPAK